MAHAPSRHLLIDAADGLWRAAVLGDGILTDLYIDREDRPSLAGAVILGRVVRVAAGMDAAFVDIGQPRPGLLPAADVRATPDQPPPPRSGKKGDGGRAGIGARLQAGQAVLVQVRADAVGGKGALLSMDVSLPGRFVVHTPLAPGVHVSRRIGGAGPDAAAVRQRLGALLQDVVGGAAGGWVVRAAAATADPALVAAEAEALALDWRSVRDELAHPLSPGLSPGAGPVVLLPAPTAPQRALIEQGGRGLAAITVAGGALLAGLRAWAGLRAPDLAPLMRAHSGTSRLFDQGDVDGAIADLLEPHVPLAQGGSLVIERTEALTVIDVNGGDRGDPLAVNLAAVPEIARQLRLRNVGGVVVVDFLTLKRPADQERLLLALTGAVADDPGNTQVYGLSRLGLVELTRQRRGPSLLDLLAAGSLS